MGIADCERLLPPIVDGTRVAHPLSAAAASATGLPAGLPVVVAYLDVICTALGGGLYDRSGAVGLTILGSTGMHMRYVAAADDVRLNEARSGYTMCFPIPGACAAVQSNMAATLNIDWLLDIACEANAIAGQPTKRAALLAGMDDRVLAAPPGAALYHPYIFEAGERGPFLDPNARAQFSGLSSATTFTGMMRAVYEGLAFASRDCYLAMGSIPREVRLGGGAARSQAIRTILAAALDAKVRVVKREETGAAGAAMIAALQLGRYADMPACVEEWVDPYLGDFTVPDANLTAPYRELYEVYRSVRQVMPSAWADLAHIRQERRA
jgi:erythritol kinase